MSKVTYEVSFTVTMRNKTDVPYRESLSLYRDHIIETDSLLKVERLVDAVTRAVEAAQREIK
jgi:hypothetical protein